MSPFTLYYKNVLRQLGGVKIMQ